MINPTFTINLEKYQKIDREIRAIKEFVSVIDNINLQKIIRTRLNTIQNKILSCWDAETQEFIKSSKEQGEF